MDLEQKLAATFSPKRFWRIFDYLQETYGRRNPIAKISLIILPYLVSVGGLVAAFYVTQHLDSLRPTPLLLPFSVIMLTAVYSSRGPLFATLICGMLLQNYLFFGTRSNFDPNSISVPRLIIFLIVIYILYATVSRLKAAEAQIRHTALHDHLTNLPNRILLEDRMQQTLERARRNQGSFAVLFVDLDNFKKINDAYGHAVGDELLKETADRITASIRNEDSVARLGGDEFIILLEEVKDTADALTVAEKIAESATVPLIFNDISITITYSIGLAVYPFHGFTIRDLLHNADVALYRAKALGKNRFQIYSKI